jgi:uncharacterized protein
MKESRYNVWVERGQAAYVFNGVSGALLRVARESRAALENFLAGAPGDCSPAFLERLIIGRMLIPDDADELELLAHRYESSRYDTSHFALTIVTSLGCNFDCPYCFEAKHPSILDQEVEGAILEVLDDQLQRIRSFHVTWFGGEPLVGKKPLLSLSREFLRRCTEHNVSYSSTIVTNGYLLDERTCLELLEAEVRNAQVGLDGPPEVHDRMRPLAGGKGTFWQIVKNLHDAVKHLQISIRVNVDAENIQRVEDLFKILAAEGFSGKLTVYAGQLVATGDYAAAPSATYQPRCFSSLQFARAELRFNELAAAYGFCNPQLPRPTRAPCTAVRANEMVVGSAGELYKCWVSVGNPGEAIGNIKEYRNPNGRLHKWLKYTPFSDAECRECIALPVCMGGCAQHAMDLMQRDNRCGTFRHTYREQVLKFVDAAERSGFVPINLGVQPERRMETR